MSSSANWCHITTRERERGRVLFAKLGAQCAIFHCEPHKWITRRDKRSMHHGKGRLLIISVDRNPRNSFGSYQRNDGCTMALRSASLLDCLWIAGLTVLLLNQRCTSMQNRQEIMYSAVLHGSYHMQCVSCMFKSCLRSNCCKCWVHTWSDHITLSESSHNSETAYTWS